MSDNKVVGQTAEPATTTATPGSADCSTTSRIQVVVANEQNVQNNKFKFQWANLFSHMGPAFLMCIAYVDPGNLEADLQTGAQTGYRLLWVLLWSTCMGFLLQSLSSKLGVVTRHHLAEHCRFVYPIAPRILLWLMAELAIIGSDVQEVIGTAIAIFLLSGGALPLWGGVLIAAVAAYILLMLERFGVHWLERFFQLMIVVMAVSFASMFFSVDVNYAQIARGLVVPYMSAKALPVAAGLLGSIIMPHNLYLYSALVHARTLPGGRRATKRESIWYYNLEACIALFATLLINIFVISVFSKGFYQKDGADVIGLENAGEFLGERFGNYMAIIWAIGLLAAGQSSTMTGTYAGQFVMHGFLNLKIKPHLRALITRAVAIIPTLIVAIYAEGDSTRLDIMNQALNILQSIQLPFVVVPLLIFTSSADVMTDDFKNNRLTTIASWAVAFLVIAVNMGTVFSSFFLHLSVAVKVVVSLVVVLYVAFVGYLIIYPLKYGKHTGMPEEPLEEPVLASSGVTENSSGDAVPANEAVDDGNDDGK